MSFSPIGLTNQEGPRKQEQPIDLYLTGDSRRTIMRICNVSQSNLKRFVRQFKAGGHVLRKPGQGRQRKTSPQDDRVIVLAVKKDPFITANEVKESLDLPSSYL